MGQQQQQKGGTPPPVSSSTAGLPAPPLQPPSAQSSYAPQPANAQPTNPNPPALPEQGANVQGDVWAPGTSPQGGYNGYGGANGYGGGKSSKGATPPQMGGANGQGGQPGGTPQSQSPQQQPNTPVQQIAPTQGANGQSGLSGAKNWQNFQFQDASHPYAQKFNQLMQSQGPGAAYKYILNADGGQGRTFLENAWGGLSDENTEGKQTYKNLVNTIGGQGNALGMADKDYYAMMRQGSGLDARRAQRKATGWVGPNKKGGA